VEDSKTVAKKGVLDKKGDLSAECRALQKACKLTNCKDE
jgi:hypothetical protein